MVRIFISLHWDNGSASAGSRLHQLSLNGCDYLPDIHFEIPSEAMSLATSGGLHGLRHRDDLTAAKDAVDAVDVHEGGVFPPVE